MSSSPIPVKELARVSREKGRQQPPHPLPVLRAFREPFYRKALPALQKIASAQGLHKKSRLYKNRRVLHKNSYS